MNNLCVIQRCQIPILSRTLACSCNDSEKEGGGKEKSLVFLCSPLSQKGFAGLPSLACRRAANEHNKRKPCQKRSSSSMTDSSASGSMSPSSLVRCAMSSFSLRQTIQKGTRVLISLWDSLMFGRVPGTRPNISESHSEISTRVPFCIASIA